MLPINLLHLADIHIGMENYGRLDPASGLNSRVVDFLRRMSEAIDYALAHEVDVCIFAGDAYKNQRPNPTMQREFARRIKRLSDAGVPTVLLIGNHDMSTADRAASSLDIFGTLDVPNVIVAGRETLHQITCRRGQPLQVATVPYPQRSRLLSNEEYRDMAIESLDKALVEIVGQNIAAMAQEAGLKPDVPAVLAGHFSVSGVTYGSEQSVMLGRDVVILKSVLADPVWDYVALGHIHKHQNVNNGNKPPIVYPGSLERIDFGEEGEPKGFVMVQLEKGNADWQFVPVDCRKFTTIHVDVRQAKDDPMTKIQDTLEAYFLKDAVVRVIIDATEENDPLIEDRSIQQTLREAAYVAGIIHKVEWSRRSRIRQENIESLLPLEALSLYFESVEIESARREELLKHAEALIQAGADKA